ncbi:MAG: hypothetical protein Q9184_003960 [Pyrenodesmia sp. 2 TL-2023]
MGLECVYPANQGRNKRQENNTRCRPTIQRKTTPPARIVYDEAESWARNGQVDYGEELVFDDLHDNTFDDSRINESLFGPWIMDSPMQHSTDGGSSSSGNGNPASKFDPTTSESAFPAYSRSATVASLGQLPERSVLNTSSTSLLSLASTDSADDSGLWEGPHTVHGKIPRATKADGHDTIGSTSDPLSLEPWGKTRQESDSCRCLLDSISFLERMASRSASRENRIDLLLAEVRNYLETLAILMACERCAARVEHNTLLAMAARQISVICAKMANCYKAMYLYGFGDTTKSSQQKPELYAPADPVDISVSTYRVNRRERLHLLESLVNLQILEFQQHLNTIKTRHCNRPNQGQAEALTETENHVKLAKIAISSHSSEIWTRTLGK